MTTETSNARGEWVLVPRELTQGMRSALARAVNASCNTDEWYAHTLAAAPPPADAEQQGQAVAFEGTDREVLREFIRMCREDKPVGQWPGERVCAAIERSMANERPFRFIAEADMAPEREPSMKDADRALSGPRRNTAPPPSAPVGVEAIAAEIRASLGRGATASTRRRWAIELEALAQQPAAVDEADKGGYA